MLYSITFSNAVKNIGDRVLFDCRDLHYVKAPYELCVKKQINSGTPIVVEFQDDKDHYSVFMEEDVPWKKYDAQLLGIEDNKKNSCINDFSGHSDVFLSRLS